MNFPFAINFDEFLKFSHKNLIEYLAKNKALVIDGVQDFDEFYKFLKTRVAVSMRPKHPASHKDYPELVHVSDNLYEGKLQKGLLTNGNLPLHFDGILNDIVESGIFLWCKKSADHGGAIRLIDVQRVYNDLPLKMKAAIETLEVTYDLSYQTLFRLYGLQLTGEGSKDLINTQEIYLQNFPLVRRSPFSGEKTLFFLFNLFHSFPLLPEYLPSEKLFEELKKCLLNSKYQRVLKLKNNQALIFDQIALMHGRDAFTGERVVVRGLFR